MGWLSGCELAAEWRADCMKRCRTVGWWPDCGVWVTGWPPGGMGRWVADGPPGSMERWAAGWPPGCMER